MKVAILGAGGMGAVHARAWKRSPVEEIRFVDHNPARAIEFGKAFDLEPEISIQSALSWADIVDICLPTDIHAETIMASLRAGNPTLCEKPLARTEQEIFDVLECAEKTGGTCMPGQVVRYFPDFKLGHDMVSAGKVGRVAAIRTRRSGYKKSDSADWFGKFERSGGVTLDVAVHDFDWILWTFGKVKSVYSKRRHPVEGDVDHSLTLLELESGAVAHVEASWFDPLGFGAQFEIAGSEGLLQFDSRATAGLKKSKQGGQKWESQYGASIDPYFKQIESFYESVVSSSKPPVDLIAGANAAFVALAALKSAELGVKVAPKHV